MRETGRWGVGEPIVGLLRVLFGLALLSKSRFHKGGSRATRVEANTWRGVAQGGRERGASVRCGGEGTQVKKIAQLRARKIHSSERKTLVKAPISQICQFPAGSPCVWGRSSHCCVTGTTCRMGGASYPPAGLLGLGGRTGVPRTSFASPTSTPRGSSGPSPVNSGPASQPARLPTLPAQTTLPK